ncbi:MAG TPA: FAD-dependent oxidoreductase, partial [Mycobacterium sp.]
MRVVIAGGGIGGLATAAAFAQRGWDVTVYERQSELRTVGSGIYIWENGVQVLEELGAYKQATSESFYGNAFEHRDASGAIVDTLAVPDGHRLVTVMRSRLLESLETACQRAGVVIETSQEVVSASPKGELVLARGDNIRADLAIGIDGIWSNVRRGLGIRSTHEITAEGCLRTIIRREAADFAPRDMGKYIENWSGSRRLLITPISDTEIYLALTCLDDDLEARRIPVDIPLWVAVFPQWKHLIERISGPVT